MAMTPERAQTIALRALAHIAEDQRRLDGLMTMTGLEESELRARPDDPMLLAGVLDFLLGHEPSLLEFCEACGIDPVEPGRARALLPGAAEPM